MVHANFKKTGKTEVVLEAPNGEKTIFDITIARDTYKIKDTYITSTNNGNLKLHTYNNICSNQSTHKFERRI